MRLIEKWFPTREISIESIRERTRGTASPIMWIHVWWARRPLIGMRTVVAASLVESDGEEVRRKFLKAVGLVSSGSGPEGDYPGQPRRPAYSYKPDVAALAKLAGRDLSQIRLLDAFAGGGSIPFEALRLGIGEVVAIEYNPVAYILLKAVVEYPAKYGKKLADDVEKWAHWLLENVKRELKPYFPRHPRGNPTNYIWVRVYRCPIHGVGAPSIAMETLSKDAPVGLKMEGTSLKLVKDRGEKTYDRKGVKCPRGHVISSEELKKIHAREMEKWEQGMYGHQPAVLAAVRLDTGEYVEPTPEMLEAYRKAEEELRRHFHQWLGEYIPDQEIPPGDKTKELLSRGFRYFYQLFNARQLLVHATIVRLIKEAYRRILEESGDPEYARAVVTYLALAHGKLLDYNSVLTTWNSRDKGVIRAVFDRHDFNVGQDFGEGDMITDRAGLLDWALFSDVGVVSAVKRLVELVSGVDGRVSVVLGDATDPGTYAGLGEFDLVVTDPPYYGNVNYAELSDYFYVWHRLTLGELYPEAFKWALTPKDREVVVNKTRRCDEKCFEERMRDALENIRYVLKKDGLLVIVYGHRSFTGLKALFKATFDAGFYISGLWSFASEMPRSLHIMGKAAVRSNIVVVFRPREQVEPCVARPGLVSEIMEEAAAAFRTTYFELGLSITDALMAAYSAAFKVVSKCWPLKTVEGEEYKLEELEKIVNRSVARAFSNAILKGEVDGWSLVYLIARAVYGEPSYDDLRRLCSGAGIDHEEFIRRYCGKPHESKDEKVYPVLSLLDLKANMGGALVDALASALRAAKIGGVEGAVKELEERGIRLGPETCRYVEELAKYAEEEERELLGVILARCNVNGVRRNNGEKKNGEGITLDKFF